jgi:hypothetical protein
MRSLLLPVLVMALAWLVAPAAFAQTPGKRLPVPSDDKLAESKKLIADVYRSEHAKASTPELKLALSARLMDDARNTTDDPASKYALLLVARDIAASAGDWEATIAAIIPLAETFKVDAFALADDARAKIDMADKPPKDAKAAFRMIMDLTEAAVSKDRFDIAVRLTASAQRIARNGRDAITAKQLAEYAADLQKDSRTFGLLKPDLETLERNPTNAGANLAVGRFRALEQHRWREGIPLLALGSDAELAKLATQELSDPDTAAERLAIADAWWYLADARKADAKALRRHAADLYLRVRSSLEGLAQKRVDARLVAIEKWHSKDATYTVSTVNGEYDRKYPPLPTLLNNVDQFHTHDGSGFAFIITDRNAHVVIDLKKEVAVARLYILNRNGSQQRAQGMRVFLSNSPGSRGEVIWQAPDRANEWNVLLDRLYVGRYLVLARDSNQPDDAFFHLRKVKVFGPE